MAKINPALLARPLFITLAAKLKEISVGKVRHTYELPNWPDYLLVVASDRISIFDFVLNALVLFKGAVLTAMTIDWLVNVFSDVPHHLVAYGAVIDEYLPEELRGKTELQSRAMVVRKLKMFPIEFVIRGFLMGSGLKSYRETGEVCGVALPAGLKAGSELPEPILTPSTKAEDGHDQAINFDEMVGILGTWLRDNGIDRDPTELAEEARDLALALYERAKEYARERGIYLLDTKLEFGLDANGQLTVADEVFTPDSSRFCLKEDYLLAMASGTTPVTRDKQYVRDQGAKVPTPFFDKPGFDGVRIIGIDQLDPENDQHVDFVSNLMWPDTTLKRTTEIYLDITGRLTGVDLPKFQRNIMRIGI